MAPAPCMHGGGRLQTLTATSLGPLLPLLDLPSLRLWSFSGLLDGVCSYRESLSTKTMLSQNKEMASNHSWDDDRASWLLDL